MQQQVQLIECPRDAMQGWPRQIPTSDKIKYLNALLRCGFDTLDFGSFVSPKAIPQMADTAHVVDQLVLTGSNTKLLAIVANLRGAEHALKHSSIDFLGFPFSVSPTFQMKNANSTIEASLVRVAGIQNCCLKHEKKLVIYLSMAFGNPYGDMYDEDEVIEWAHKINSLGVKTISLADTVGVATPDQVFRITGDLIKALPETSIGVHLHSTPENWREKLDAAFMAGCRRFDGALKGIGGCPMAGNDLVGNMNTEWMLDYFQTKNAAPSINEEQLKICSTMAEEVFK